jgi:ppGpp synthetase/RelA/SpoT-type nucleotidyltranferase
MSLPISRSQLDRLGERLSAASSVGEEDRVLLEQVLAAYDEALAAAQARLEGLGFAVTGRLKTTGTLIEKLRREKGMKLKGVQDVAGVRIVVRGTRREQDEAVARIVTAYSGQPKRPHVTDRRAKPSSGYRAVHVVVSECGLPVEVQVRTELQDLWAQVFERLGDRWGRAIRYGGEPDKPDARAFGMTRLDVVDAMQEFSDQIERVERMRSAMVDVELGLMRYVGETDADEYQALVTDDEETRSAVARLEGNLRRTLEVLGRYAIQEGGPA